ncbi:hypothetical protein T069G_01717 [Trichoderma breve]|uniref:Transcription factor domain-containing protein n=1 Tax=Trichoderma breve TaxID=2034170 RepID=A0A9W9JT29_9HYPO|nr:hypothetical protein T069G_01717 [Trichoderma breve]KAJ4865187.1 hypothetical protein T069G_01717 [Trichoderma breve]
MVSHNQKPKAGGSQDPNSARKLRPRPKPSFCRKGDCRRDDPTASCIGCDTNAVIKEIRVCLPKAAADDGSDSTQCDITMTTEDDDNDLMKIDSSSGSNDNGEDEVPHTNANEGAATTEDNSSKTEEVPIPAQKDIAFQARPPVLALPSELLSSITPWTPVDSSTLMGPPAAKSHATHMAATTSNIYASIPMDTPAIMKEATSMNPAAYYASFPGSLNSASSVASPAFTAPATMPPRTVMGQSSMSSSATTNPPTSIGTPTVTNPQGFVASPTFKGPSTSMSPSAVGPWVSDTAGPDFIVPREDISTAADFYSAAMDDSTEMGYPMIRTPIPLRIIRPRVKVNRLRMRKRPPTAARPRQQPALNPGAHMLPSPAENSRAPGESLAPTSSSNAANPPSITISAPSTTSPVEIDSTRGTTSPVVDNNPPSLVSATPETTFPVPTGPALTNMAVNESSSVVSGPTCTSLPATTDALTTENPQVTMDCALLKSLSAALKTENPQMEAHLKAYEPPPTNAGNYLYIIQTSYCYTSRAADGIPMKLDPITKKELIHLEVLVTNPPISSTPPFFMPPRSLSIYLLKIYRHEVYFTYPFFNMNQFTDVVMKFFMLITKSDVSSAYLGLGCSDESNPTTPLFQCSLFMMLWHAVYFANIEQEDKEFASAIFWKCAKFFMTEELLETSCLAAVQTQLIIAVALNSSNLQGNERKIPAELAYRIAQCLGIDNEKNLPTAAAEGVHDANRQAWFSQTRHSQLPLNSGMSKSPLATRRYQSPAGSVDFNFFINCVIRAEELEKILKDIRKTRESVLEPFTEDLYKQYATIVPILRGKLREFINLLPKELGWGISGLPDEYVRIGNFNEPKATSNANFMHLRAMLFRPILMHTGIDGYLETKSITIKIDPVVKDKTLTYAMSCVNTAISLIDFLYKRFLVEIKNNREWWWSPYHTSTAGLVLIMAQTSPTLWSHVQVSLVEKAWKSCQHMLGYGGTDNHFHERALRFLWGVNKRIAGICVLENRYDVLKLRLPTPAVTWSYQRTPQSQSVNRRSPVQEPGSTSHPAYPNSNSNAPLQASNPNRWPSAFPYAAPSSSNAAPFTASAASTNFTTRSSASNGMTSSGSGAVANAAFANYNTVPCAPLPNTSTVPPFTASSSVHTTQFTAPWTSGAVPPFNAPASTAYPVSDSSGSGPFPFSWDSNMVPPAAPETAEVSYTVASHSMAVTSTDSSGYTIAPYATSSQWNMTPYATSSESATFAHTDGTDSNTAPTTTSSCVTPATYTGPYTAFSDPNATLYTEESANLNGAVWPDMSAYNLTAASSSTMTSLSPSNPNLANYGNMEDVDGAEMGMGTQVFYQPSTKGYTYYSPDDDAFMACNEQR